jgi:hypothetical protein
MILKHLQSYIDNTEDPRINFNLGHEYETWGQTGAAISFYLRTAERSDNDLIQYESLLRCALCFSRQGTRDSTEKTLIQKAIALYPERPEAYFILSRYYETRKDWQDSYTAASLALAICNKENEQLITDLGYPGSYCLLFQKGVAAWWIGHTDEAREIMADLKFNHPLNYNYRQAVENNIGLVGYAFTISPYTKDMKDSIICSFDNIDLIDKNYSQSYQDMFVLAALNGKKNGVYLEIGSAEPFKNNNTALLETKFDWTGASFEIVYRLYDYFREERSNPVYNADATQVNWREFLSSNNFPRVIDYLQVDCDPPSVSFQILQNIPFDEYKFAVITFEHDYYADPSVKEQSRKLLLSKGYELIGSDIAYNKIHSFEDWWVHRDLVDNDRRIKLQSSTAEINYAKDYMFPNIIEPTSRYNIDAMHGVWIVDNFYSDPDAIREFALKQEYHQGGFGRGYIGCRTYQQFLFPGLKERFEEIMGRKITKWEEHGMNGRFQYSMEGEPLVYHCDSQKWAGMIYLTPDAPYRSGTGTWAVKGTDIRHNSHPDIMKGFRPGSQNLDRTIFERVDDFGNVYNRLVIFNAGYLHSATDYFGFTPENCRLWHMFFFD